MVKTDRPVILLDRKLEYDLIDACRRRLPYEACGILSGRASAHTIAVEHFTMIRNVAASPGNRFAFDPNDWIAACINAQKNQRRIVGVFHSHPRGSGEPSALDEQSLTPWESYWIISFANDEGTIDVYKRDAMQRYLPLPIVREP